MTHTAVQLTTDPEGTVIGLCSCGRVRSAPKYSYVYESDGLAMVSRWLQEHIAASNPSASAGPDQCEFVWGGATHRHECSSFKGHGSPHICGVQASGIFKCDDTWHFPGDPNGGVPTEPAGVQRDTDETPDTPVKYGDTPVKYGSDALAYIAALEAAGHGLYGCTDADWLQARRARDRWDEVRARKPASLLMPTPPDPYRGDPPPLPLEPAEGQGTDACLLCGTHEPHGHRWDGEKDTRYSNHNYGGPADCCCGGRLAFVEGFEHTPSRCGPTSDDGPGTTPVALAIAALENLSYVELRDALDLMSTRERVRWRRVLKKAVPSNVAGGEK